MNKLDSTLPTPLYQQLEDVLLNSIENGTLQEGKQLPTESELSEEYGVSRVTVRKALRALEDRGYLVRKAGKGTFVRENKLQRKLSSVLSYSDMCRKLGYKPGAKTIRIGLEMPTSEEATELGISQTDNILVIERIRYASGKPTMIEINKFSEEFFFLFEENLNDTSLYEVIQQRKGISFTNSVKELEIVFSNYQESKYLGISVGYPLLQIRSLVEDATFQYRQISIQLCIADKFKLIV